MRRRSGQRPSVFPVFAAPPPPPLETARYSLFVIHRHSYSVIICNQEFQSIIIILLVIVIVLVPLHLHGETIPIDEIILPFLLPLQAIECLPTGETSLIDSFSHLLLFSPSLPLPPPYPGPRYGDESMSSIVSSTNSVPRSANSTFNRLRHQPNNCEYFED